MIKVIFFTEVDLSGFSGQHIATAEIVTALIQSPEVELTLVCPQPAAHLPAPIAQLKSVDFLPAKNVNPLLWHFRAQGSTFRIHWKHLRYRRFEVLITRLGVSTILPPLMAKYYHLPYVLLIRGMGRSTQKGLKAKIFRFFRKSILEKINLWAADRVYVAFERIKQDLVSTNPAAKGKIKIIPNGIAAGRFPLFSLIEARELLNLPIAATDYVIGFAGSIKERHGIRLLLEAFHHFQALNPESRLLIVGSGPLEEQLKSQASDYGIKDMVLFTGNVPHTEVSSYLAACDVLYGIIHPELPSNPIKCYEYLASGRPIITTRSPELEFVSEIGAGITLEEYSTNGIMKALQESVHLTRQERLKMGRVGREYVLANHTWEHLTNQIIQEFPVWAK